MPTPPGRKDVGFAAPPDRDCGRYTRTCLDDEHDVTNDCWSGGGQLSLSLSSYQCHTVVNSSAIVH